MKLVEAAKRLNIVAGQIARLFGGYPARLMEDHRVRLLLMDAYREIMEVELSLRAAARNRGVQP